MTARDEAEILFANDRFYAAFAAGDAGEMGRIWGSEGPVACLHPGWERLMDRNHVLASWTAILQAPPPIRCHAPTVLSLGQDGAAVLCWEEIDGNYLIATNVFRRESEGWKIVHHQAGPTPEKPPGAESSGDESARVN